MTPEEYEQQLYRLVFNTPDGVKVLTHLLTNLGFFKETVNEDEVILNNFAKKILRYLGITPNPILDGGHNQDRREEIVTKLLEIK